LTLLLVVNLGRKGIKASYINSDSLKDNPGLVKDVARSVYQIVNAGPEMTSPNNNAIWQVLDDENSAFWRSLNVVVVDEAHCVHAWGAPAKDGKPPFRKEYANIGGFQAILPASVPFLAMSAILPHRSLRYIHYSLG
jgi:superfamily II DNA helicase RecQ